MTILIAFGTLMLWGALLTGVISVIVAIIRHLWWYWLLGMMIFCLAVGSAARFAIPTFWGIRQHAETHHEAIAAAETTTPPTYSVGSGVYRAAPQGSSAASGVPVTDVQANSAESASGDAATGADDSASSVATHSPQTDSTTIVAWPDTFTEGIAETPPPQHHSNVPVWGAP